MTWDLPYTVEVGGVDRRIRTEYRDILRIIAYLTDEDKNSQVRIFVALNMFYVDFEDIQQPLYDEATQQMMWFIACGEEDDGKPHPKTIDWEQDYQMIVADVNKVAMREIRGPEKTHWWTFMALFGGIGDGQLSMVVGIREKLRTGKKLQDWERDFLNKNRSRVVFKKKYTSEEQEEIDRLNKILNGG